MLLFCFHNNHGWSQRPHDLFFSSKHKVRVSERPASCFQTPVKSLTGPVPRVTVTSLRRAPVKATLTSNALAPEGARRTPWGRKGKKEAELETLSPEKQRSHSARVYWSPAKFTSRSTQTAPQRTHAHTHTSKNSFSS